MTEGKLFKVLDWDLTPKEIKAKATSIGGPAWYSDSEYVVGTLIEFLKEDGSRWLVKFGNGVEGTNKIKVLEYPERKRVIVLNEAYLYLVDSEKEKAELLNPHLPFKEFLTCTDNRFVTFDDTNIYIIETNGDIWISPPISWDGFQNLVIENNNIKGSTYTPVDSRQEWYPFTLNLETKEITGGPYSKDTENNDLAKWEAKII